MLEFLRFGSQIPGAYYGCCAVDIIQGFGCDPKAPASIQVTDGDSGMPYTKDGHFVFLGPTNLDVFKQRLRIGTFYHREQPNHAFLAVLTGDQVNSPYNKAGREWLAILKDHGFEFIRAFRNSVYSFARPPVYLFGLFRNLEGELDMFRPPDEWTALPECKLSQQEVWKRDKPVLMTADELRAVNAPVTLAGLKPPHSSLPREMPATETVNLNDVCAIEDDEEELAEYYQIEDEEFEEL